MAAAARPGDGKGESAVQQRVSGILSQARQHLIRNNAKAAAALLKDIAAMPDCPTDQRLEAAKMLGTAGANPEAALCYLSAGLALLYDQGDMTRARQAFASAHNLDPQNLDVIFHLGQADVVEGRTQDGLAKFIDVLRKSNLKHTPALFEAGCIYQANGQYDQAILAFKKVLDREKSHIQAIVHMGQLHQIKGMIPEAIGYYLQAAQITREAQQFGTTRQIVNMVLAIDGNNARARSMLADLDDKGEEEEGESEKSAESAAMPEPIASAPVPTPTPIHEEEPVATAPPPAPMASKASSEDDRVARVEFEKLAQQREAAAAELARLRAEIEKTARESQEQLARVEQARRAAEQQRSVAEEQQAAAEQQRSAAEQERVAAEERTAAEEERLATELQEREEIAAARAAAEQELEAVRAGIAQAQAEAEEAALNREAIERATAELDAKLALLQSEVENAEQHKTQAQSKGMASVKELEQRAKALQTQCAQEEKRLAAAQSQATQLQTDLAKAETAHEAAMLELAARRQRAQADLEKLQSAANDVARAKDAERQRAELSVAELDTKASQLRKELSAAEARRKEAEAKAGAAEKALATLEARIGETKAKAETASADLRDIVDQTRSAQASSTDLSSRMSELQAAVEAAESKKRVLEDSIGKVRPLAAAAEKRRGEAEAASSAAEKAREKREAELAALDAKKHDLEESFTKTKSLVTAAEQKRAEAEAAAEQAEALRTKREADAEALSARIAMLEAMLHDADAMAKTSAAEGAALVELSAKVNEQRAAVLELEAHKAQAERELSQLSMDLESTRKAVEDAQGTLAAQTQTQRESAEIDAEAIAAIVPAETCVESLRTIEALAADDELPLERATELAGLIHEGRATQALHEARKNANLEAAPGSYLLVSGDLARDLGDIAAAREAYKTLAAADPSRAHLAQSRMGDLFLAFAQRSTAAALARDDAHFAAVADPAKAIETYAELVARFPEDPTFREELGALHEQLGNKGAAALAYTQALVEYLGCDDVTRAADLSPKLLAIQPTDGPAHELAAKAYDRVGRHADAKAALDHALRCYHAASAASDVERVCTRLAEVAEDPVPYRRELAGLLLEAGDGSGAAEQLLEAAEKLIAWSRGTDAAQLLEEAAALAPEDDIVRERVTALRARAADVARAVDDVARGDLLVGKGDYQRATQAYQRALEENPHDAGASYQLACLLMDHSKDYEMAERLLENASELRPNHAATRYRLALVKAARGHVVEAVELLIAMARFDESNADFIEQFAERLEKDAESGEVAAKYRLGIAYRELGRVDEALVILQSIQREHDYIVLCHNAIGLCLRRQGLDTAAAKRFSKAIETPGYPEAQYHDALYNLGELYEAKDTPESLALALSSFEELYASDCTFKDVGDRIKSVKGRMGAVERPKVKRLPTRTAERG